MSYVKEFLVPEEASVEEGPSIEDGLLEITRQLWDPPNRDITLRLMELVKCDNLSAEEVVERLGKLVAEILVIQSEAICFIKEQKEAKQ
jgi:hypothetical protein